MRELIVAADGVEESKLLCRYCRFAEQRIPVDIAGARVRTITGKHGYTSEAALSFADVEPNHHDVLVLPRGRPPRR